MLLRRANGDLSVCRALGADMEVDDGPIGFHAQQAVEKALKIALVLADVNCRGPTISSSWPGWSATPALTFRPTCRTLSG